jgi:hypothetical protein
VSPIVWLMAVVVAMACADAGYTVGAVVFGGLALASAVATAFRMMGYGR